MAAIGYRLTGRIPFDGIVLLEPDESAAEPEALVAEHGGVRVRLALLRGGPDLQPAAADLEELRSLHVAPDPLPDWDAAGASRRSRDSVAIPGPRAGARGSAAAA